MSLAAVPNKVPAVRLPGLVGLRCDHAFAERLSANNLAHALQSGLRTIDLGDTFRVTPETEELRDKLAAALEETGLSRDDLYLIAHTGLIPLYPGRPVLNDGTQTAQIAVSFVQKGLFEWNDVVRFDHVWAPTFLDTQVRTVHERLDFGCIDLWLLEGANLLFDYVTKEAGMRMVRNAFEQMEAFIADGLLLKYGVTISDQTQGEIEVDDLIATARDVAGKKHNFGHLQLSTPVHRLWRHTKLIQHCAQNGISVHIVLQASDANELVASLPESLDEALVEQRVRGDIANLALLLRSLPGVDTCLVQPVRRTQMTECAQVLEAQPLAGEAVTAWVQAFAEETKEA